MLRPALLSLALLGTGCELLAAAGATSLVSGTVIRTPAVSAAGQFDLPASLVASSWVGEREGSTSTSVRPTSGAKVELVFAGNRVLMPESEEEPGLYSVDAASDPKLVYADVTYLFRATLPGDEEARARVDAPKALTDEGVILSPEPTVRLPAPFEQVGRHDEGAALRVSWPEGFGRFAFLSVLRSNPADTGAPELVFDNRPKNAEEAIKWVAGSPVDSIEVPGEAFAQDGMYAVNLVLMEKGRPEEGTFLGSPVLAGSSATKLLWVGAAGP